MRRSLRGQRVVVTRAAHQAEELAQPLRDAGAEPLLLPLIGIAPPEDKSPLVMAAMQANDYDWLIFTSANAVAAFAAELPETGEWFRPKIAAVGPATAEMADTYGFRVEIIPASYVAESLADAFRPFPLDGKRILIPSAAVTRDVVPRELRARGARVDVVCAYRNVIPEGAQQRALEIFAAPWPDWVTFASSSAVDHLLALIPQESLNEVRIASIGPATSSTIATSGLRIAVEAAPHTIAGLVEAMRRA